MISLYMDAIHLPSPMTPIGALFIFFTFSLGACLGSFTNVLIHRIPLDMSVVHPPSACPQCRREIRWFENIPILSYLVLRGRCRGCKTSISSQYPVIEFIIGVWSFALGVRVLWPMFSQPEQWVNTPSSLLPYASQWIWYTLFVSALIAIAWIDLRYTFVPDEISLSMIWIGLIGAFLNPVNLPLELFFGALFGYLALYAVRWLGTLYYGREAMGLGDAKLLAMIGIFLGWRALPWVLMGAAIQGLIAAMIALSFTRVTGRSNLLTMTYEELAERFGEDVDPDQSVMLVMPFGPFLCLAAFEVLMIGVDPIVDALALS